MKTLGRTDREDQQGWAPLATVDVEEALPDVGWEMSARSWRSEAPQHCNAAASAPAIGNLTPLSFLAGLPSDPRGGDTKGVTRAAQKGLVLVDLDKLLAII